MCTESFKANRRIFREDPSVNVKSTVKGSRTVSLRARILLKAITKETVSNFTSFPLFYTSKPSPRSAPSRTPPSRTFRCQDRSPGGCRWRHRSRTWWVGRSVLRVLCLSRWWRGRRWGRGSANYRSSAADPPSCSWGVGRPGLAASSYCSPVEEVFDSLVCCFLKWLGWIRGNGSICRREDDCAKEQTARGWSRRSLKFGLCLK